MNRPVTPGERATALILTPALMLVLLALAAIAVDLSMLHSAHRHAHRVVATAADDAAGLVDAEHLQVTGVARVDRTAAHRLVANRLEQVSLPGSLSGPPEVSFDDDSLVVTVSVSIEVAHVINRSVTGRTTTVLDLTASARMIR